MTPPVSGQIRYRKITELDFAAVVSLLLRHFPRRSEAYWMRGFERLQKREPIEGCPRFGYLLESDGRPVGVLLLIFTRTTFDGGFGLRCNLSSWCVEPEFAGYSSLLSAAALKQKQVVYLNISPADHTVRTITAQGFSCYSEGQYLAVPAVCGLNAGGLVRAFDARSDYGSAISQREFECLADHATYGCLALTVTDGGNVHPFVFIPRTIGLGPIRPPCVHLCYCRNIADFRKFAGPLGRYLLLRGKLITLLDANGPLPGLPGRFFGGRAPKYFCGPHAPRLGDLAYTELALFGP